MFQDYLFFGTDLGMNYAFRMVHLSHLVRFARQRHGLSGPKAIFLAECMVGSLLLASLLDEEERVNLRFLFGQDVTVAAETTRFGEMKAYLDSLDDSPLIADLEAGARFFGDITVRSVRSKPGATKMFEGITSSCCGGIEEALRHHLAQSYQLKCDLRLQAWLDASGELFAFGVVHMELPHLEAKKAETLWNHVRALPSMQELYERGSDPDVLASALIPDNVRAIRSLNPVWKCTCSLDAIERMLVTMPRTELQSLIDGGEGATIACHYCGESYVISHERLVAIFAGATIQ